MTLRHHGVATVFTNSWIPDSKFKTRGRWATENAKCGKVNDNTFKIFIFSFEIFKEFNKTEPGRLGCTTTTTLLEPKIELNTIYKISKIKIKMSTWLPKITSIG